MKASMAFVASRRPAGRRTLQSLLHEGIAIGRYKARRLLQEQGLVCKQPGPHKEKKLIEAFGEKYLIYRNNVRPWI